MTCHKQFPIVGDKDHKSRLIGHHLQYQRRKLKDYFKGFNFHVSDITNHDLIFLIDKLVDVRDVYFHHKFNLGKSRQRFHDTMKPDIKLNGQGFGKDSFHSKGNLASLVRQLKDAAVFSEMGDDVEMGSIFVNPNNLMPKKDYVKLVIDARYLNFVTDLTNYIWPVESMKMNMTRLKGKFFSVVH